jgi:hypothetical protein
MRPKLKPEPPKHLVVTDTNVLWHEDKANVINPDFQKFWDNNISTFPMELILPEVVRGELLFQQTTSALKALKSANEDFAIVSKITDKKYSHRVTDDRVRNAVEARFDGWASKLSARIVSTPIQEIDWHRVISDSIWRRIPFTTDPKNSTNEKGFRDAMILETLVSICKNSSRIEQVAFVCNDFALRRAAERRLSSDATCSTYENLADFENFIKLTHENLTEEFVRKIRLRATQKFWTKNPFKGLIKDADVLGKARSQFLEKLDSPKTLLNPGSLLTMLNKSEWTPLGDEGIRISGAQFVELESPDTYVWSSRVTFARRFGMPPTSLGAIPGIERLRILHVDVIWSADVKSDARFFNLQFREIKEGGYSFEPPTIDQSRRYGLTPPDAGNDSEENTSD